jgi:hypothetical protein
MEFICSVFVALWTGVVDVASGYSLAFCFKLEKLECIVVLKICSRQCIIIYMMDRKAALGGDDETIEDRSRRLLL